MQNRPEDRPLVIVLSLAIIGVFGFVVWQRVRVSSASPSEATTIVSPKTALTTSAPSQAAQGQMRYLDDKTLDAADARSSDITLHADAFRSLARSSATARSDVRPMGPPAMGLPPMSPTTAMSGSQAARNDTVEPPILVTLDGVLNSDTSSAEAMLTLHDPRITDAELSERTVMVQIGDRFGKYPIVRIGPDGVQFQGATWWPIGQVRRLHRTQTIVQFVTPRSTKSGSESQRADIAKPDRSEGIEPLKLTARRNADSDADIDQ